MSNPNHNKPGGKPGPRNRKPDQQRSHKPDQPPSRKSQLPPEDTKVVVAEVATANAPRVDLQTIATAYGAYTRKSFEETKAFVEKLSGVRSLDKAIAIQTEFAGQVYETFVVESQKICELYASLARQAFKPLEGFVTNPAPAVH